VTLAWPDRAALARAPGRVRAYLDRRAERADDAWIERNAVAIDALLDRTARVDLRFRWGEACKRVGLGQQVVTPLGGTATGKIPRPISFTLGPPDHLVVEMPPGVIVEDLEHYGPELSESLGVWRLRFTPITPPYVRVDLVESDPLAAPVLFLPPHPEGHVVFGCDEHGGTVSTPLEHLTHLVAQGPTRSGKSAFTYQFLAQLAPLARSGLVDVAGLDPTGSVLRPWGEHPRGWRQWGTRDVVDRYTAAVEGVLGEMERRIAGMPLRADVVPIGPGCPLIVVVLEEWPAVCRLTGHKRQKASRVHEGISRLLAEGAKAGVRVVTLAQRADSDNGGVDPFQRDQSLTRLTFRGADAGTVKMLHECDVPDDVVAAQAVAGAGSALLTAPGVQLMRIRSPWLGSYSRYVDAVTDGVVAVAA
jgi:hypothetical protein